MVALLALGVSLVVLDRAGEYSEFCTADGLLGPSPDGWEWARDHHNSCAWTLFNDGGDRAPQALYGLVSIDPPQKYPSNFDWVGWLLIGGSLAGGAMSFRMT